MPETTPDGVLRPEEIPRQVYDALALAKERVEEILATHKPKPLTAREEQIVEDVLKQAREYYKKEGLISDEEWTVYMKTLESVD